MKIIKSARPIPYSNFEKGLLLITILLSKTANCHWVFSSSETAHIKIKAKKKYSVHELRIKKLKRKSTKKCNTFVSSPFSKGEQLKLGFVCQIISDFHSSLALLKWISPLRQTSHSFTDSYAGWLETDATGHPRVSVEVVDEDEFEENKPSSFTK